MSFTDLASLAEQQRQQQRLPPQPPPQQQQDPTQLPPDPRSFSHSPTNPVAAIQTASIDASHIPAGLESNEDLGDVSKTKDKTAEAKPGEPAEAEPATEEADTYPPVTFAPENYRAPAANRGPDEWGTEPSHIKMAGQYPGVVSDRNMPTPALAHKEVRDTGAALAQWGPPAVAELSGQGSFLMRPFAPILDALSQGKFSRNFTVAALRGLEIRRQEALDKFETANQLHAQILQSYGSIMRQAADGTISQRQAEQMVSDYANQIGDNSVLAELDRNGLRGVVGWLNWQDAFHRRQLAATTQLRKVAGPADKEQREFDALGGRRSAPGSDGGALGVDPSTLPGRGGPEAPETPTKDQGEPLNPYEELITSHLRDANGNPLTPQMATSILSEARRRMLRDPDAMRSTTKGSQADNAIGQAQMALEANISRIAKLKPSPGETPEQHRQKQLEAISQNNSDEANALRGLIDYTLDPHSEQLKNRAHLITLAQQLDPNYDQGKYALVHKFSDPNAKENQVITRVGNLDQNYLNFARSLNATSETKAPWGRAADKWISGNLTGDPQMDAVYNNLFTLGNQLNAILTLTGTPRVGLVHDWLQTLKSTGSPRSLRTQIVQDYSDAFRTLSGYQDQWERATGKNTLLPGMSPENYEMMRAIVRTNPNTGEVPSDAPPELQSVGRKIQDSERLKKGTDQLDPDKLKPLTMVEVHQLQDFIKLNSNSPDPEKRQQAQVAINRLGPQLGLGRRIRGVDEDANAPRR